MQQSITSISDLTTGSQAESDWRQRLATILSRLDQQSNAHGYTGTVTTAKLTSGGANGSMVFVNGRVVSQTAAT